MTPIAPIIQLRNFLEIPYDELEELNLSAKKKILDHVPAHKLQDEYLKKLTDEKRLKAVTVCFTDLSTPASSAITGWIWDFGDGDWRLW
jgi:hypothetical protein